MDLLAGTRDRSVLDCGSAEVAAEDVRRACLTPGIDPYGLRLANARITGPLDLRAATVPVPLWFDSCEFTDPVAVEGAVLHELVITDSVLPGLLGDGVRIAHNLILSGSTIRADLTTPVSRGRTAAVWLLDAEIGGRLFALGSKIISEAGQALQCGRAHIRGEIRLAHGFEAVGSVRLLAIRLDGYLDLAGATLTCTAGPALDLNEATVGGSVFLMDAVPSGVRATVHGRIELGRATIGGQLLLRNADLHASSAEQENSIAEHTAARPALLGPHLTVHGRCAIQGTTEIYGGIFLPGADLRNGVQFDGAKIHNAGEMALDLSNAVLNAGLHLAEASILGTVNVRNSRVAGVVVLSGTTLTDPWRQWSLRAAGLRAEGDVELINVTAHGGLDFRGATIAGMVDAEDATIINPSGQTLGLQSARVEGNVRIRGRFRSIGELILARATVGGRLRADGATLAWKTDPSAKWPRSNPLGLAVNAASTSFLGGIDLGWRVEEGGVDLSHATATYLFDRPDADWPVDTWLGGFTYERFVSAADAPSRIAWLSRLRPNDPRAWEQVARVLRAGGDHAGADEVLIAQRRHARRTRAVPQSRLRRAFDAMQDLTVRYGFRPQRAIAVLLLLIAMVTASLSIPVTAATMRATDQDATVYIPSAGCGDGKVRCFSPFFYAVDTVVPIIDLKQRETWYPGPGARGTAILWWLNVCTVLGWVASTIFALSFTRLGRSSGG